MADGPGSVVLPLPSLEPPQDQPVDVRCHHVQEDVHHQAASQGAVPGAQFV